MRLLAGLLLAAVALVGCRDVKAWERGVHADRRRRWTNTPERCAGRQHVLAVREGAQGGHGADGSGCGCD